MVISNIHLSIFKVTNYAYQIIMFLVPMYFSITDIAAIKIGPNLEPGKPTQFDFSRGRNLAPIEFSKKTPEDLVGKHFTVSGWGQTERSRIDMVDDLRVVEMEFVDPSSATSPINRNLVLVAAQEKTKSVCDGDIGGNNIFFNVPTSAIQPFILWSICF